MKQHSDQELMGLIAKGSAPAFEELFVRYGSKVLGYCTRMVSDRATGEDLAQDVWIKVTKAAPDWRPEASLSAWLLTIARHTSLNYLRGQNRLQALPENDEDIKVEVSQDLGRQSVEDLLIASENRTRVARALDLLTDMQRSAILMWLREEMSYEDIARELNLSTAAVKSLLFRARTDLEKYFGTDAGVKLARS